MQIRPIDLYACGTIFENTIEKNGGTQQTKRGGEFIFKTKRTLKTKVTKTSFLRIVSQHFS